MPIEIKESDWKLFRRLHEVALERFCKRTLEEMQDLAATSAGSYHDRYLKVYRLLRARDKEMAAAFNGPRRFTSFIALAHFMNRGLLIEEELDQFSPEARQTVNIYRNI